ncbi:MAG: ImmA/IrrE family metallo-endopeptidase [Angustibacter sp.]
MSWSPWRQVRSHPQVLVHRCRLDEGLGWWCPTDQVILLDDRLDAVTARCVLAHELAHAVLSHESCHDYGDSQWLAARVEAIADDWADRRLIRVPDLVAALCAAPDDPAEVAAQLEVTPQVLRRRLIRLTPAERSVVQRRWARLEPAS